MLAGNLCLNAQVITSVGKTDKDGRITFLSFDKNIFLKVEPNMSDLKIQITDGKAKILDFPSDLKNADISTFIPNTTLEGNWKQSAILNAPMLVQGASNVVCSLDNSFMIRLMANNSNNYLELGQVLVKSLSAFGGECSKVEIFSRGRNDQKASKIIEYRVEDKLFQYIPKEMFIVDKNYLCIASCSGQSGVNSLLVIDLQTKRLLGCLRGSQIQYLPYMSSFWVRDTFTRADANQKTFDLHSLKTHIVSLTYNGKFNSESFDLEGFVSVFP